MAGDVPPPRAKIAADQRDRFEKIFDVFQKIHGKKPHCYVRAPGRINLIGEHIDYCGYAVLPMAIEQAVVIAVGVNKTNHTIQMTNTNASFTPYSCETTEVQIDAHHPQWYHYVLCGYRGVVEHAHLTHLDDLVGLELVVDSTLPMSAGLSSSSALVCAAALATMQAYKLQLNKRELAEICQHCERYIGTEGGGMDQAIAFLADAGTAKLVEFDPIRTQDVRLPENAAFVVSNCCVDKHKATTSEFNTRVAECRLACQILAKAKGLDWRLYQRLGDLQSKLGASFDEMLTLVKHTLHEQPYSKAEVCNVLHVSPDELDKISLSEKSRTVEMFKLHQRAVHVYSEAGRVWKFKAICDKQPPDALKQLGQLMTDSHASCRDLYECSCTELDQLVTLACASGSLGSRLTGAGWGGCAISLVQSSQVDSFIQKVAQGYYGNNERLKACLPTALFATLPGYGATVFD